MPCPGFVNPEGLAQIPRKNIQPRRKSREQGLGTGKRARAEPENRETRLGTGPEKHPRIGTTAIRAWLRTIV